MIRYNPERIDTLRRRIHCWFRMVQRWYQKQVVNMFNARNSVLLVSLCWKFEQIITRLKVRCCHGNAQVHSSVSCFKYRERRSAFNAFPIPIPVVPGSVLTVEYSHWVHLSGLCRAKRHVAMSACIAFLFWNNIYAPELYCTFKTVCIKLS